jgi:ubiquinone/menaquinone biosynthesis C-methylase UbiE
MQVKRRFEGLWNRQYKSPRGLMGWLAGERMVRQHGPETAWTLRLLEIEPTDTVLEVGFGAGQGIKLAAEQARHGRVMGIDLSEMMVWVATRRNAQAVKAGRVALAQGAITALPFADQSFDKIMTIHTFYFWPEPIRALSELSRVLKPGGRLIITLSTGKINARGEVEVWPPFQAALQEQVMPGMRREGFQIVRLEPGPTSRQYTSVAVIGEKERDPSCA